MQQMYCSNCRAALYPNATGCHQCGAVFRMQPPPSQPSATPPQFASPQNAPPQYAPPPYEPPQYAPPQYAQPQFPPPPAPYGAPHAGAMYMPPGMGAPRTMGFGRAVSTCFRKYATFSGRAGRPEFWWFYLFTFLYYFALSIIGGFVAGAAIAGGGGDADSALAGLGAMWIIILLGTLPLLLPTLAACVRRLHDTDRSGWWLLLSAIPIVGGIVILVFLASSGSPGPNRFGVSAEQ